MNYLLLAWSQGNCAAKAGARKRTCTYASGSMRGAWMKGFDAGLIARHGHVQVGTRMRAGRRAAA